MEVKEVNKVNKVKKEVKELREEGPLCFIASAPEKRKTSLGILYIQKRVRLNKGTGVRGI